MKDLKDILEGGILNDIEDTLANSDKDVKNAKRAMRRKTIVNGITSNDPWKQERAIDMFEEIFTDNHVQKYYGINNIKRHDAYENYWFIQFKKCNVQVIPQIILFKKQTSYWYVIYIDKYGNEPRYAKFPEPSYKQISQFLAPRYNDLYRVPKDLENLDKICDEIFRIMYYK